MLKGEILRGKSIFKKTVEAKEMEIEQGSIPWRGYRKIVEVDKEGIPLLDG